MRALLLCSFLMLALCAGCTEDANTPSNPVSTGTLSKTQVTRPWQGDFTGTALTTGVTTSPYSIVVTTTGTGNALHLGLSSVTVVMSVGWFCQSTPCSGPFAGTGTVTAANGDAVYLTYSGTFDAPDPLPTWNAMTGTYTVTGGTGRFEGATGSGAISAEEELLDLAGSHYILMHFNGTITY